MLTSVSSQEPLLDDLRPFLVELHVVPGAATSTFENLYDSAGRRTQILREIAAPLGPSDVPCAWCDTWLVHLAPLTGEVDPALAAHFPNATVLLTPQGWLRERDEHGLVRFRHWFDADVLRHVDIVVFSEEDIAAAPDLEAAFAASVAWLFVTRAERGGTCYHHGAPFDYATPQLPVVNTTGAGDVFAAAVLACAHRLERDMPRAMPGGRATGRHHHHPPLAGRRTHAARSQTSPEPSGATMSVVERVLFNGQIRTQDPARQLVSALALVGERIVAAGTDEEMLALAGPGSARDDLGGQHVIPGLIDAHIHWAEWNGACFAGGGCLRAALERGSASACAAARARDRARRMD